MIAAWDWYLPKNTPEECRHLVELVTSIGFDTLVTGAPSSDLIDIGHSSGIKIVAVVSPAADDAFADTHPKALQRMQEHEERMSEIYRSADGEKADRRAHRWFPLFQGGRLFCYEHEASRSAILSKITEALATADGVALDGFGFRNHYACFCDVCTAEHGRDPEGIARFSERSLIEISRLIYEHAKAADVDAIVTNHVWPPFDPNPYYGSKLYLDFCSQTISWFYRPVWDIERVRLEAELHKRYEDASRNHFVPFIGTYHDGYLRRNAERIKTELEIAGEYGEGSLVFCTLQGPAEDIQIRELLTSFISGLI